MNDALIRLILIAISIITILSGLTQMVVPQFVLGIIKADTSMSSQHFFLTIGMFMAVVGSLFLQTLLKRSEELSIPIWMGTQKIAAGILVGWGVVKGVFGFLALGVALFDFLSGILIFIFMLRLLK